MHQPLTIAKVRKETKITVPAGGWAILVSPDEPFSTHAEKRREVMAKGMVNEDIAILVVGRMDNKYSDAVFQTAKEKKEADETLSRDQARIAGSSEEAQKIQVKQDEDRKAYEAAEHKKRVAEINKVNDAIRTKA